MTPSTYSNLDTYCLFNQLKNYNGSNTFHNVLSPICIKIMFFCHISWNIFAYTFNFTWKILWNIYIEFMNVLYLNSMYLWIYGGNTFLKVLSSISIKIYIFLLYLLEFFSKDFKITWKIVWNMDMKFMKVYHLLLGVTTLSQQLLMIDILDLQSIHVHDTK